MEKKNTEGKIKENGIIQLREKMSGKHNVECKSILQGIKNLSAHMMVRTGGSALGSKGNFITARIMKDRKSFP